MPTASDGPIYPDTSALVKMYFEEAESRASNACLVGRGDVVIAEPTVTKMASALARRCRDETLDWASADRTRKEPQGHIESGVFRR